MSDVLDISEQHEIVSYPAAILYHSKKINNEESSIVKKFKTSAGKWKTVRVWWIPEFASEVEVNDIIVEQEEVPF